MGACVKILVRPFMVERDDPRHDGRRTATTTRTAYETRKTFAATTHVTLAEVQQGSREQASIDMGAIVVQTRHHRRNTAGGLDSSAPVVNIATS